MRLAVLLAISAVALPAQSRFQSPFVEATGTATISVAPDQAQITAGVITQAPTAKEAAEQNATRTTAVLNALKAVLGTSGKIQTAGYSIQPRYNNAQPAAIIGYTASNSVQVTTTNLSLVGPLIDAASQAGANNMGGINFGLQDPQAAQQQALSKATKAALGHSAAIAQGVGGKTGPVISIKEGSTVVPLRAEFSAAAVPTPIEAGKVTVHATVTATVQLVQ